MGALGEAVRRLQAGDAAALETIGRQQQGLGQRSLDLAYEDFLRQQNYPREMVDWMSQIVRGLPAPTATTTTQTGPADVYGPSPLAQIASLYSVSQGLQQPGQGNKRGGHVKGYSDMPQKPYSMQMRRYAKGGLASANVIEGEYEVVS